MSVAEVLAAGVGAAGLSDAIEPFDATPGASLAERLTSNPFIMAPMAGVTDAAYRLMARSGGAALAYSEMVSVAGIHYGGEKTWELVYPHENEPDVAVQLFGSKPDQFREAAAEVCRRVGPKLALIDVNMACPVPKVTRKGEGSALMDTPELAADIVRAVVAESCVPVTVKIRRGRTAPVENAADFARAMEDAGADAVAVHGRYGSQLYRGEADWDVVRRVAEAVSVPVIGSGDVTDAEAAVRMLRETGATAVMVARGSYGNPWVFGEARALMSGDKCVGPTPDQRIEAFALHVRLLAETDAHLARARSLAGWYLKGMPHAARWRGSAMTCTTLEDYLAMVDELARLVAAGE